MDILKLIQPKNKLYKEKILNKSFNVRYGTIPKKVDYDHAWVLALSNFAESAFDIGANVGLDSLLMTIPGKLKRLIVVDPNPEAMVIAAENIIRNCPTLIVNFITAFASDDNNQTINFYTVGSGAAGSKYSSHAESAAKKGLKFTVNTVTLDNLSKLFNIVPDLIKIDVEGAERETLNGAKAIALYRKTCFIVEMHSNPDLSMEDNAKSILNWCSDLKYKAWYLKDGKELKSFEKINHRGRCHLLLQPDDWSYPNILNNLEQGAALEKVNFNL